MRLVLTCALLAGCSTGGLLVGDDPDAWAKRYCFKGQGSGSAGAPPWASGSIMGDISSHGVTKFGDISDAVLLELAKQPCPELAR